MLWLVYAFEALIRCGPTHFPRVRRFCLKSYIYIYIYIHKLSYVIFPWKSELNICHRFVSLMPYVSLIVFSFLLKMVEGIGTAMYRTATFSLLSQLYPSKKGMVAVSIQSSVSILQLYIFPNLCTTLILWYSRLHESAEVRIRFILWFSSLLLQGFCNLL